MVPRMLSMDFDTSGRSKSYFRILANKAVKYITIAPAALDADSLEDMPLNFVDVLPPLPYDDSGWNAAYISRLDSGKLNTSLTQLQLPGVTELWHPNMVDFQELDRIQSLSALTQECKWATPFPSLGNTIMIAKMARFEWEIPYIQQETRIYGLLQDTIIAPRVLGHIHEQGRVIGILLEMVAGRPAGVQDLQLCYSVLDQLHSLGIAHGDCNRYNFIVDSNSKVTLLDFEKSVVDASHDAMAAEKDRLRQELVEESGRGGGFVPVPDNEA